MQLLKYYRLFKLKLSIKKCYNKTIKFYNNIEYHEENKDNINNIKKYIKILRKDRVIKNELIKALLNFKSCIEKFLEVLNDNDRAKLSVETDSFKNGISNLIDNIQNYNFKYSNETIERCKNYAAAFDSLYKTMQKF